MPFLSHDAPLPPPARSLVSPKAKAVLTFFSAYLDHYRLAYCDANGCDRRRSGDDDDDDGVVDLYVGGGYVRDLLLGRISPDLDLSINLSNLNRRQQEEAENDGETCTTPIGVIDVLQNMDEFCKSSSIAWKLGIQSVSVFQNQSGIARKKQIDAVCVDLQFTGYDGETGGEVISVDVLPTIGREVYTDGDRVPVRDCTGASAEEDSARRDLTIGSLLLQVTTSSSSSDVSTVDQKTSTIPTTNDSSSSSSSNDGDNNNNNLQLILLDYHGGIEDLSTRTLRCPTPNTATLADCWNRLVVSPEDRLLAASLGLVPPLPPIARPSSSSSKDSDDDDYGYDNVDWTRDLDWTKIRALHWAISLRDDPYRLLRTLRFSVTLGFRIDQTFYIAAPFAILQSSPSSSSSSFTSSSTPSSYESAFSSKVSHTRKIDELRKVAAVAGSMAFWEIILRPWVVGGYALRDGFLNSDALRARVAAVKGGGGGGNVDGFGEVEGGEEVLGILDWFRVQRLKPRVPSGLSIDGRVGFAMVIALYGAEIVRRDSGSGGIDNRLARMEYLVTAACEGLQTPNTVRRAALRPLSIARRLVVPLHDGGGVNGADMLMARAVPWPNLPSEPYSMVERAARFQTMVRMWDAFRLDPKYKNLNNDGGEADADVDPVWIMGLIAAAAADCRPLATNTGSGGVSVVGGMNSEEGKEQKRGEEEGGGGGSREETPEQTVRRLEADLDLLLSSMQATASSSPSTSANTSTSTFPGRRLRLRLGFGFGQGQSSPSSSSASSSSSSFTAINDDADNNNNKNKRQSRSGGSIGGAIAGLPEVPPHLRSWMISAVQVLMYLRGGISNTSSSSSVVVLETSDDVRLFLDEECDGLLTKLTKEWWVTREDEREYDTVDGGFIGVELRSEYVKR